MTTTEAPSPPPAAGWTARRARELVLSRMAGVTGGVIELQEGSETRSVGTVPPGQVEPLSARVWVHHPRLFQRMLWGGTLAAGESYIDGDWDCSDLTALIRLLVRNERTLQGMDRGSSRLLIGMASAWHRLRPNSKTGSRRNISAHYDLGNEFFELFLDQSMMYSSAIFPNAESSLYEASIEKLDVICRKLRLGPGERVIEIGTGWG
ncbi:MAG: class I SAM-dependent methyltransferase, partial [Planctomycetaceae bacterium]